MSDWNGVTVEELINWLTSNAGSRAGVSAADGVISVFDIETGEAMDKISVDQLLTNNKVTILLEGEKKNEGAKALFIDMIDGGLDQHIEGRLIDLGFDAEISSSDQYARSQSFTIK